MVTFLLETLEQQHARENRPENQACTQYEKRAAANSRPHCLCGRFAKPGHDYGQDFQGEYNWTVICKEHGEVWMS